jgi:hypothetical protein
VHWLCPLSTSFGVITLSVCLLSLKPRRSLSASTVDQSITRSTSNTDDHPRVLCPSSCTLIPVARKSGGLRSREELVPPANRLLPRLPTSSSRSLQASEESLLPSFSLLPPQITAPSDNMCYQLVELYSACRCLYYQHAIDRCAAYGRPGHSIETRTIYVGYACSSCSSRASEYASSYAYGDSGYHSGHSHSHGYR